MVLTLRKLTLLLLLMSLVLAVGGCRKNRMANPIATVDSVQPDKVLFDRGMESLNRGRYEVARLAFQTLINTYPDSEFVARAKLGIGDAWYKEGGSAALAQAEAEYKDFRTFFPNMPEAAEAQLKVANIHFRQMEKPDRDFKHAQRAEEEFKIMLQEHPDHPLVDEARLRLLQVQEVLAERQYRIGRFYYLRESYPAAIARLTTLVETYPLYSGAHDAMMMLADIHERQAKLLSNTGPSTPEKENLVAQLYDQAASWYGRVLTRYPATESAPDARRRLAAMSREIPEPTPEMLAQNQEEEASRSETGRFGRLMGNFRKRPDVAAATRVGEPTMTPPPMVSAPQVVQRMSEQINTALGITGSGTVTLEQLRDGETLEDQPLPRSTPNPQQEQQQEAPPQVNEVEGGGQQQPQAQNKNSSSSKKKRGWSRLNPF